MQYRTKLYLSHVTLAFISILLALIIFSVETEKFVFNMFRSRNLSIAATAAAQLNPDDVKESLKATVATDPMYTKVRNILINIMAANRRDDIYIADMYIIFPDPKDPKNLIYGPEIDPPLPGVPYTDSDKDLIIKNKEKYFTDPDFVADEYGVWLSGFAPIRDKDGKYIATLSVDIDAADIYAQLKNLLRFAFWGFSFALVLAFILSFFLSKKVTHSLHHLRNVVREIGKGNFNARSELRTKDEFGELGDMINTMGVGLQERERLKISFARYVSTHIMEKILRSESSLRLEGERRKVTVLFSDIRQFTFLAERLPPEQVVNLLNEYFEQMIEVIFTHFGTLDKFIGDGIMAEFGAPLDDDKQEEHAVRAAIAMQRALDTLCTKWEKEGKPRIQMGIGIHTGDAVVGNIGSERRTEYTAIGDTVNVAARLEQATKMLGTSILLSEMTYLSLKNQFPFKSLGSMTLPGRKEQINVYTIELDKL